MAKPPEHKQRSTQPFDKGVGLFMRTHRNRKKLSQNELGDELGVTFQQIQKYEKGSNRLAFARAAQLADLFNVTLDEFAGRNGSKKLTRAIDRIDFALAEEFSELDPELKPEALSILKFLNKQSVRKRKK